MLASYSSLGPSKFNQISDGRQNGVKTTAKDIDEFTQKLASSIKIRGSIPRRTKATQTKE